MQPHDQGEPAVSGDATDRLRAFAALLLRWNGTLNLIAPKDAAVVWERHIQDSLQLAPLIPAGVDRAIDLGSGGGFPGLVLAIATGVRFALIESDRRKSSFLRTAIMETGAPATVHACRIEDAQIRPAPLVTARALAPLRGLLGLARPLLESGGTCLFLKGAKAAEEIAEARAGWRMMVDAIPSRTHDGGAILRITSLESL